NTRRNGLPSRPCQQRRITKIRCRRRHAINLAHATNAVARELVSMPEPARLTRVLFVSQADAARSRIAAAWLRSIAGDRFEAHSAGTDPSTELDPAASRVMREVGIELPPDPPRSVTGLRADQYDLMVVLRPREEGNVPPLPGVPEVMYWSFAKLGDLQESESEARLERARRMRDELRTRVGLLVSTRS